MKKVDYYYAHIVVNTSLPFFLAVDHFMEMFISMANQRMDDATFVTLNDEYSKAFCAVQQWYTQRTDAANYFCTGSVTSSSIGMSSDCVPILLLYRLTYNI